MCVDHRGINAVTKPLICPLLRFEVIVQHLKGAKCFGVSDAHKGFWQSVTEKASRAFAYQTHDGVYRPSRVPMGSRNGATHFQRVMTNLFKRKVTVQGGFSLFRRYSCLF